MLEVLIYEYIHRILFIFAFCMTKFWLYHWQKGYDTKVGLVGTKTKTNIWSHDLECMEENEIIQLFNETINNPT